MTVQTNPTSAAETERGAPPAEVLLGRPAFATAADLPRGSDWVAGRRVLLTGAAGSVGAPLAQALLDAHPASLVLVDHHEHSLFSLERALGPAREGLHYELLDLRSAARLPRVFARYRPEIVIHLAAAKHVPYGERFPDAAVEANVLTTTAMLDLAEQWDVATFVYPSSDKSVSPPSLYGATKRICEGLVERAARANGRRWVVVRFVNIIGTRGSVIETFTQQLLRGAPLTVTDERMTRYWISMEEAIWSVLQAGRGAVPGGVVMPDCGDAVALLDTARRLSTWYQPRRQPYPIGLTGIRPGERLHEVLLSSNEWFAPGPARGVLSVQTRRDPACLDHLPDVVNDLRVRFARGDDAGIVGLAMRTAQDLQ